MLYARHLRVVVLLVFVIGAAVVPALAQGVAQPSAPGQPQTAPATAPIPVGARIGFVNLQVVFSESNPGQQGQERWRVLNDKLFAGLSARNKEIQGLTEKIQSQRSVVADGVLKQWNQDLARLQREAQFAQQEAQVLSEQAQQDVLADFERLILPVINALRVEKKLDAILAIQADPGGLSLLSVEPGLDLSAEVVKRLNAAKRP
ncbi:MAG TPA: OmpH family outer membrane protein [Vicinamibacterales bacterium]|nr:OmpH family outer membrane protein [Vicinamibacterales bacterium]